ncbi:MAG: PAS domain-containing protein [Candidatus Heimdallarchaeaceae archaeon]
MENHQLIWDCINNINAYVVIVGHEGKVIFANKRTLNLFSTDQGSIHEKKFYNMLKDSDTSQKNVEFYISFKRLIQFLQNNSFLETTHTKKHGFTTILWSAKSVNNYTYFTGYDVSIFKAIEEELRTSFEKYKIIFNNTLDAMYLIKITEEYPEGIFIDVNKAASLQTGYTIRELLDFDPKLFFKDFYSQIFSINTIGPYTFVNKLQNKEGKSKEKEELDLMHTLMNKLEEEIYRYLVLIDKIRNPLTVISALADLEKTKYSEKIISKVNDINDILLEIDDSLIITEKLRNKILKYISEYLE